MDEQKDLKDPIAIRHFLIRVPKTHKDEIELSNGQKLFLDNIFNQTQHRSHEGTVVSAPVKLRSQIKKGARVWFHHMVTPLDRPQKLIGDIYYAGWTDHIEATNDNQIFAYQNEGEEIKPFQWWLFVKPVETTKNLQSKVLDLTYVNSKNVQNVGEVAFISDKAKKYLGVNVGEKIVYTENQRYEVHIDGEIYFKVRPTAVLYAIEKETA